MSDTFNPTSPTDNKSGIESKCRTHTHPTEFIIDAGENELTREPTEAVGPSSLLSGAGVEGRGGGGSEEEEEEEVGGKGKRQASSEGVFMKPAMPEPRSVTMLIGELRVGDPEGRGVENEDKIIMNDERIRFNEKDYIGDKLKSGKIPEEDRWDEMVNSQSIGQS